MKIGLPAQSSPAWQPEKHRPLFLSFFFFSLSTSSSSKWLGEKSEEKKGNV